jgi:SAM-dependent methyltransferase
MSGLGGTEAATRLPLEDAVPSGPELLPTACAICGTIANADELYPATLTREAFTAAVFSARRLPDGLHYRMVRCRACGLVRSDPVMDSDSLFELYRSSAFDYGEELDGLRVAYGRALGQVERLVPDRRGLLDIGAGNGFVLQLAADLGWTDLHGVEPSADAIAQADPAIRDRLICDVMRTGLFEPQSLGAITLFQVLDHLPQPRAVLEECRELLRPGGVVLAFNHNVAAWSARLMGERSPIIDVEHTYLYSAQTMRRLFERAGLEVVSVRPALNTYSLLYLTRLLPLPHHVKTVLLNRLSGTRLGQSRWSVPLGNLCLMARRPL